MARTSLKHRFVPTGTRDWETRAANQACAIARNARLSAIDGRLRAASGGSIFLVRANRPGLLKRRGALGIRASAAHIPMKTEAILLFPKKPIPSIIFRGDTRPAALASAK